MKHSSLFLIFFIFLVTGNVQAQDASARLSWKATQLTDLLSATTSAYTAEFETNGAQPILWKQKGGARITTLTVTSVDGTWNNVQSLGKVTYHITSNGKNGTLVFERTDSLLHIVLDLPLDSGGKLSYDFLVSSVQVVQ